MRKLLNTLYVMTEDCYLTLDGENVVIQNGEKTLGRFPLHTLENIICFTYKGASPALMGACAERKIGMSFFSPRGAFLARVIGKEYGNVLLRKEQYRISDRDDRKIAYAKNMIIGKVYNCRWSIERTLRDHAHRVDAERLKEVSNTLYNTLPRIDTVSELEELRGIEGKAAEQYFSVFNDMILNYKFPNLPYYRGAADQVFFLGRPLGRFGLSSAGFFLGLPRFLGAGLGIGFERPRASSSSNT